MNVSLLSKRNLLLFPLETGAATYQVEREAPTEKIAGKTFDLEDDASEPAPEVKAAPEGEDQTARELNGGLENKLVSVDEKKAEEVKKGLRVESDLEKATREINEANAKKLAEDKKQVVKPKLGELPEFETKKTEEKTTEKKKYPEGDRDLSAFPAEMHEHLKKMGNEAFEYFKQEIPRLKNELEDAKKYAKGEVPKSLAQHPNAYTLLPRYQQISTDLQYGQFEANFWEQQLVAIREGKPFRLLEGYDGDSGKPVYSKEIDPSAQADVKVSSKLREAQQYITNNQANAQVIQQNYQKTWNDSMSYVNNILDKHWPWHKDPKAPEQQYRNEYLSAVPELFHNHPSTYAASIMWATVRKQQEEINSLRNQQTKGIITTEEQKKMDPKVTNGNGAGSSSNGKTAEQIRLERGLTPKNNYTPPAMFDMED